MTARAEAGLRIEQLDASDPAAMTAWHETFLASHRHERPFATPLMLEELRARFTAGLEAQHYLAFSGLLGDEVAAVGMCYLTMRDNLDQAFVEVQTRPDLRGRGIGGRVLDHLEQTGDLDRTVVVLVSDNGCSAEGGPHGHLRTGPVRPDGRSPWTGSRTGPVLIRAAAGYPVRWVTTRGW